MATWTNAIRQFGRANYDVTPRVHLFGDEIYIANRAALSSDELEDINNRLATPTFARNAKFYPRQGSASPRIRVSISNTSSPFSEVSRRQLQRITERLLKPTYGTRLRQVGLTHVRTSGSPRGTSGGNPKHYAPFPVGLEAYSICIGAYKSSAPTNDIIPRPSTSVLKSAIGNGKERPF